MQHLPASAVPSSLGDVQLQFDLPASHRERASFLYWQAFAGKLGRLMGPEHKARSYLETCLCPRHVLIAQHAQDGALLGLIGFKSPQGSFIAPDPVALRRIYGPLGAAWRRAALALVVSDIDNERFLIDGICVAPSVRDQGIGTALIEGLCVEARARGYRAARLDVALNNPRAKALYERLGFEPLRLSPSNFAAKLLALGPSLSMVRPL